jgi:hypothetical protein
MNQEPLPSDNQQTPNPIRVETALSRYPVHRLARKGTIDINIVSGEASGNETRWEVDYSKKHGQPGPLAYKLDTLIINRRIEEARRPLTRLLKLGSLSDIAKELSLADSGKNRANIKNALFQNAFAGITAKTQYKLADGTLRTLESGFTRYSIILTGEELPGGRKADAVYIILNDVFMQVINGAMTRPLDYDYLKSLPPAPQRFYELLSYQMYAALKYDRPRAKLTYSELCAHAPQTRHLEWEDVRSQMNKVHKPHKDSGYIIDVKYDETTDRQGNRDWVMCYLPGPKARAEFKAFTKRGGPCVLEIEPLDAPLSLALLGPPPLQDDLVRRGITPKVAKELVANHSEAKIQFQIECLDWQLDKHPNKIVEPAAYLKEAIENDYAAPKKFVSKLEQERRDDAKKARERQEAETRRQKLAKEAAELVKHKRDTAYWESLTPAEQGVLQAKADAVADPANLAQEFGPLISMGQCIRRREYIRTMLDQQEQITQA